MKRILVVACALYACVAQATGPDSSFGSQGRVLVSAGEATRAILQADGKLVVVGTTLPYDPYFPNFPPTPPTNADFLIARYNIDGTPDKTFAGNGLLRVDFDGGNDFAGAVTQQPDGKLVVVGSASNKAGAVAAAAIRLNPDGTLDATFNSTGKIVYDTIPVQYGIGGVIVTTYTPGAFTFNEVFALPGGKLLFSARPYQISPPGPQVGVMVRTLSDGQLDTSYGAAATGWTYNSVFRLAQKSEGDFYALLPLNFSAQVLRYDVNGVSDSSFTPLLLPYPPSAYISAPLILRSRPDGDVLVAGANGFAHLLGGAPTLITSSSFVTQVNSQGQIDTSFGAGGSVLGYQGDFDNFTWDMALEPSGKVLLAGISGRTTDINSPQDVSIARLGEHGTVDSTFGPTGRVVLDLSEGSTTYSSTPVTLLRRRDGHLIVVANRGNMSQGTFVRGSLAPEGQQIVIEQLISTPQFSSSVAAVTVAPNETSAVLTVTRTGDPDTPVSVDYATTGSVITHGTLTWQPGDANDKTVSIAVDATLHQTENQFTMTLDNPSEGTVTAGTTVVTVTANAPAPAAGGGKGGGGSIDVLLLSLLSLACAWRMRPV